MWAQCEYLTSCFPLCVNSAKIEPLRLGAFFLAIAALTASSPKQQRVWSLRLAVDTTSRHFAFGSSTHKEMAGRIIVKGNIRLEKGIDRGAPGFLSTSNRGEISSSWQRGQQIIHEAPFQESFWILHQTHSHCLQFDAH